MYSSVNKEQQIRNKLNYWYKKNKRILPWRVSGKNQLPSPYYTLVSEFMLQQTTVKAVTPKFIKFIKLWPNIKSLSKIKENSILKFWSGLGYYVRAKNLLKTVKYISKNHNNKVPSEYETLIKLPGIGDYTAKAVIGIAYNKPTLPVDANIKRIIIRIYALLNSKNKIDSKLLFYAEKLISKKNSTNIIQAFMDYGSKICLPQNPKCSECVISSYCFSYKKNIISKTILQKNNCKKIKYTNAYIIINQFNEILIRRRGSKGMLPSMLEIPNDEWLEKKMDDKKDIIISLIPKKLYRIKGIMKYSFSHFNLHIKVFHNKIIKTKIKNYKWLPLSKIDGSGLPTLMKKIIKFYQNQSINFF